MEDILTRISEMEAKFNEVSRAIATLDSALDEYEDIRSYIIDLKEYISSGRWKADFEADERGEIPAGTPRGVLSEDGLYDLFSSVDAVILRAKEINDQCSTSAN